jgi:predicted nucleotidyltransferase
MNDHDMAVQRTILRVPSGSTTMGLSVSATDRDEIGICIEPIERVAGFHPFDQYIYRTATERTGKQDEPSQPGDLDLTIYSLRKFLRLAMHGNPQIIEVFFTTNPVVQTKLGKELQDLIPHILNRQVGKRYLGYMEAQRQRLMGERGQKKTNRPELEAQFGFDTKYAMHVWRLAVQGRELMATGKLTIPMDKACREFGTGIRLGAIPLQDILTRVGELEVEVKDLISDGPLQEFADELFVEDWMISAYQWTWEVDIIKGVPV